MQIRPTETVTRDQIYGVLGRIDDSQAADIIASGATLDDVVEAFAWASSQSDLMGEARKPLAGVVERVYDILTADDVWPEEP